MKYKCTQRSDRQCPSRIVADYCCQRHDRSCYGRSSWPRLSPGCEESPPPLVAPLYPPPEARHTSTCSNLFFCNLFLVVLVCAFVGQRQIYFANCFYLRIKHFVIIQIACSLCNIQMSIAFEF